MLTTYPLNTGSFLVQEISLVQAVGHHRDKAALGLHHAPQIDLPDLQAFLPVEQPDPEACCTPD
jgi:hypothetical protein